jgi:peptidoglycan/xylan/chitin deacetylase (PgdA/CDA1 family)
MMNPNVTVCITGDIDYFDIETVEGCLEPYFKILEKYQVKMTIPITAKAVEDYPGRAEFILEQGHEIAIHGDVHQPFYGSVEEQGNRLEKAKQIFKDILGFIPSGFRAPWLEHDKNTYLALIRTGFLYDSSRGRREVLLDLPLINKISYDLGVFPLIKPFLRFYALARCRHTPAKPIFLHNQLAELPITGPDDYHFISSKYGPRYLPTQAHRIAEIWLDIVRDMKQRGNQLFVVQAHPGRMSPLYIEAIDRFLAGIINDSGVKITLLKEVAESFVAKQKRPDSSQF